MRSEVDAVVFGRDIDGSDTVTPLTELPEYAGAAGVPTWRRTRRYTSAPPARRARAANPNMRATVDEVVFGHDIDGSAAATPVAAGAAFDGAAGLDADRIRLDQLMSTKRHLRPHDDTIERALQERLGREGAARAPARPATADPSLLTAARAIRSAGVRTAASPRMSDVVTPRATATTYAPTASRCTATRPPTAPTSTAPCCRTPPTCPPRRRPGVRRPTTSARDAARSVRCRRREPVAADATGRRRRRRARRRRRRRIRPPRRRHAAGRRVRDQFFGRELSREGGHPRRRPPSSAATPRRRGGGPRAAGAAGGREGERARRPVRPGCTAARSRRAAASAARCRAAGDRRRGRARARRRRPRPMRAVGGRAAR